MRSDIFLYCDEHPKFPTLGLNFLHFFVDSDFVPVSHFVAGFVSPRQNVSTLLGGI